MKIISTFLCCALFLHTKSQDIKIYFEKKDKGYIGYVDNNSLCPVSISLNLELKNLTFSEGDKKIFVLPANTTKIKLGELNMAEPGGYGYSYKYKSSWGDVTQQTYDTAYAYELPFQKGKSFMVWQGYNGSFSHKGENSLDFSMPEGTEVLAAREGIVVKVVQDNTESCPDESCAKYGNHVIIYHADGTFAKYFHLKYKGANVKVGDTVKKGDVIAFSGNTGWSNGPHLHFSCSLPGLDKKRTIPTKFNVSGEAEAVYLVEKVVYLRGN